MPSHRALRFTRVRVWQPAYTPCFDLTQGLAPVGDCQGQGQPESELEGEAQGKVDGPLGWRRQVVEAERPDQICRKDAGGHKARRRGKEHRPKDDVKAGRLHPLVDEDGEGPAEAIYRDDPERASEPAGDVPIAEVPGWPPDHNRQDVERCRAE